MFPRREFRQIPYHRGQAFGIQAGFIREALTRFGIWSQAQYRVSIFWVVEGDALDRAGEGIHAISIHGASLMFLPSEDVSQWPEEEDGGGGEGGGEGSLTTKDAKRREDFWMRITRRNADKFSLRAAGEVGSVSREFVMRC